MLKELDISIRTFNTLSRLGITTIEELVKWTETLLMRAVKSASMIEEINDSLLQKGFFLKGNEPSSLKGHFILNYIPSLKRMLLKEQEHIEFLKQFPTIHGIDYMVNSSKDNIITLEKLISQYNVYASKL